MTAKKIQYGNFNKNHFEHLAWAQQGTVVGIDEVGRGCLAGPLVTAAVILPPGNISRLLKDSKVMTEAERLHASLWIAKNCWYAYGIVHHRIIDKHNIWQATLIAMKKALVNLMAICPQKPSSILVDAMPLNLIDTNFKDIPVHHFPFGESKSSSIAAASIMAKVKRDAMMGTLDPLFPGYLLAQHKGYSTQKHMDAIKTSQHSIIHRMSFLHNILIQEEQPHEKQQSIC